MNFNLYVFSTKLNVYSFSTNQESRLDQPLIIILSCSVVVNISKYVWLVIILAESFFYSFMKQLV